MEQDCNPFQRCKTSYSLEAYYKSFQIVITSSSKSSEAVDSIKLQPDRKVYAIREWIKSSDN